MKHDEIQIIPEANRWVVRLTENGEQVEKAFDFEAHAHSWADGQRTRLKLATLTPSKVCEDQL